MTTPDRKVVRLHDGSYRISPPADYPERVRFVHSNDYAARQLRHAAEQHRQYMRDTLAIGLGCIAAFVFLAGLAGARWMGWL